MGTGNDAAPRAVTGPVLAGVAVGGAAGALARYGLAAALPAAGSGWPWGTFTANLLAALLVGLLAPLLAGRPLLRAAVVAGLLGGLSTWSTVMVEVVERSRAGAAPEGIAYLAVSLVAGITLVVLGARLAGRITASRAR